MLADLGSENGIWVAGNRVPSVALEPNVRASLGPFRLRVEGDPVADAAPIPAAARASDPETGHAAPAGASRTAPPQPDRVPAPASKPARQWTRQQKWVAGGLSALAVVTAVIAAVILFRP